MSQATILKAAEQYTEERLRDLFDKLEIDQEERDRFLAANTELRKKVVTNRRNRRQKKDPNAPKKPLNAYMHFARDDKVRQSIKDDNDDIKQKELTVELGKRWGEMSEKERKPYTDLAAKDRKAYEKALETYNKSKGTESASTDKKSSKKSKKAEKTDEKGEKTDEKGEKSNKKADKKSDKKAEKSDKKGNKKAGKAK